MSKPPNETVRELPSVRIVQDIGNIISVRHSDGCLLHTHRGKGGRHMYQMKPTYEIALIPEENRFDIRTRTTQYLAETVVKRIEEGRTA